MNSKARNPTGVVVPNASALLLVAEQDNGELSHKSARTGFLADPAQEPIAVTRAFPPSGAARRPESDLTIMAIDPRKAPHDPAWRPPLDTRLPFPPSGEVGHPNLKEHLYANLDADKTVVDVGCGPGPFEYANYRCRFVAFDMFPPETHDGLVEDRDEFRLGRIDTFPLPDASCDAVIMGFILEHVTEPGRFLKEAERVLRPGGWLYVAIPHHRSLEDRLFRLATSVAGSTRGPHIQRFTFENFGALVQRDTSLRMTAWHFLPASFLWMAHPRLAWMRGPFLAVLRLLRGLGMDLFREANYQLLLRKPEN